jgi:hypothetical protein
MEGTESPAATAELATAFLRRTAKRNEDCLIALAEEEAVKVSSL